MSISMATISLNSGDKMPTVGLRTWKISLEQTSSLVYQAIQLGYRHFDCAYGYHNEAQVGQAIARAVSEGLVQRSELFITGKLWCAHHNHVRQAAEHSLASLQLSYFDLYLIHFPIALAYRASGKYPAAWSHEADGHVATQKVSYQETWRAMEQLVEGDGLARNIGFCNLPGAMVYDVLSYARVMPAVMQIELHPYLYRRQLVGLAQARGIVVTAYSSFGDAGYRDHGLLSRESVRTTCPLLQHPVVREIAARTGRSVAQVLLRWAVQRGCAVVPKTSSPARLAENFDVLSFELTPEDMQQLGGLDRGLIYNDPADYADHAIWAT
ncbi:D-xylose reductase [Coemansia erecta]|uniref:D-xylose reductase n=1 Tax=Coemansia erecta TaxID=147472 RepID=A0A9W8CSJ9_9FUNG|nr:D-xylose reductase [Coemansia erecta]